MRLLIATPLYPPQLGGPAKYAKEIFEELSRRSAKPILIKWGSLERFLPWGVRHFLYFLRVLVRVPRADAVLALDTLGAGFPALCAAKFFGKKYAVRIGGDILWEWYIERTGEMVKLSDFYKNPHSFTFKERLICKATKTLTHRADVLLFNTQWQLDIWQKAYGFDNAKAKVLENEFSSTKTITPAQKKVFVASGRGIRYKNIALFEKAFREVQKTHPEIELDTAPLPPEQNSARIAAAYAVVVPSVSEINSNFIIEALAYGKPFITTHDSGMYERLQGLGLFVDTLSEKALKEGIEELLDEAEYHACVERIKNFSYTHTWRQIVDELITTIK